MIFRKDRDVIFGNDRGQSLGAQLFSRLMTLFITMVILFCIYRHGDSFLGQASTVIDRLFGRAVQRLAMNMIATVRETVKGSLLIALGEGIAFGVSYAICGLPHPALLGALTGVLAIVPPACFLVSSFCSSDSAWCAIMRQRRAKSRYVPRSTSSAT